MLTLGFYSQDPLKLDETAKNEAKTLVSILKKPQKAGRRGKSVSFIDEEVAKGRKTLDAETQVCCTLF